MVSLGLLWPPGPRWMPDHKRLRLLALTGYGQPQDVTRTRDAGFDIHLVNPIDIKRLLEHISSAPARARS